jgi:lipid-binding SYLF domain-containing protein
MTRSYFLLALLVTATLAAPCHSALAQTPDQTREDARLITATQVLEELGATPDQNVPSWLLQRAYGIAVIPEVLKGAFIFGGRYGSGVLSVRNPAGRFSNPIFIQLAGGSVGWQVGATSTDVVLVFVTPRSVEKFGRGKFTLGADASVAAGPVGRQGEAQAGINAEIYSYSRTRGLFAGVALDGSVIAFDRGANRAFYDNDDVTTDMITSGKVSTRSESARRFLTAVATSTNGAAPEPPAPGAPATATPAPAPAAMAPPTSAPPPNAPDTTHTYPLEDSRPGTEPK